jgi:hypothetical protein
MTYQGITRLSRDGQFIERLSACLTQQSAIFKDDGRPDMAALAVSLLRGGTSAEATFIDMAAAAPGFTDKAETPEGGIDSSAITDADLLAAVQAMYPTVASIFFNSDGTPRD